MTASTSTVEVRFSPGILLLALLPVSAHADVYLTEGTNISVDAAADGRIAMDLLGSIWLVPENGGAARAIDSGFAPSRRPRWSPDEAALVYETATAERSELRLYHFSAQRAESLGDGRYSDRHPEWHPDGDRIVFSSARRDSGFDIWELDLETRLTWRLSSLPGNETEPAWSSDGRHLVYVHENDGNWSLVLRLHGQPDETLVTSTEPLAAPSWRPDGSLISYLRHDDDGWAVWMTILADPRLHRPLVEGRDFFLAPVAWLDRQRMLYTADGRILKRRFDSWSSRPVPFRARVGQVDTVAERPPGSRELPSQRAQQGRLVIRAARVFDGLGDDYRQRADILIADGEIVGLESQAERADTILVDLGDVTVLPGFIDAYATLPDSAVATLGPLLLGLGVTTMVAAHPDAEVLDQIWAGKAVPGPRLLRASALDEVDADGPLPWLITVGGDAAAGTAQRAAVENWQRRGVAVMADNWQVGLGSGATLLLGSETRPTSPAGHRYQDVLLATGAGEITFVSGLADAGTPGLDSLSASRPARLLGSPPRPERRFTTAPDLAPAAGLLVLGSRPNGLPPGVALHAELRALVAAGLTEAQALKAAGVNAAAALGLGLEVGRIAVGAAADLVIVDGDPLADIEAALNIVAIVRNGRFYSVSGLIDRATPTAIVE